MTIQRTSLMAHPNLVSLACARRSDGDIYSASGVRISALRKAWAKGKESVGGDGNRTLTLSTAVQELNIPDSMIGITHSSESHRTVVRCGIDDSWAVRRGKN